MQVAHCEACGFDLSHLALVTTPDRCETRFPAPGPRSQEAYDCSTPRGGESAGVARASARPRPWAPPSRGRTRGRRRALSCALCPSRSKRRSLDLAPAMCVDSGAESSEAWGGGRAMCRLEPGVAFCWPGPYTRPCVPSAQVRFVASLAPPPSCCKRLFGQAPVRGAGSPGPQRCVPAGTETGWVAVV